MVGAVEAKRVVEKEDEAAGRVVRGCHAKRSGLFPLFSLYLT